MTKDKKPETLEDVIRAKLATGYDPIKLSVKLKSTNEENVEVSIEGIPFSVRENAVSHLAKKVVAAEAPKDPAHPVNGGGVVNPDPNSDADADQLEEQKSSTDTASNTSSSDSKSESSDTAELEERKQKILSGYEADIIDPTGTADNGDTIFGLFITDEEEPLVTGTLAELETGLQNKAASESAA